MKQEETNTEFEDDRYNIHPLEIKAREDALDIISCIMAERRYEESKLE